MTVLAKLLTAVSGIAFGVLSPSVGLFAQEIDPEAQTVLSNDLWAAPRHEAMSGATTGLSDGVDAPLHNPAGIGGLHQTDNAPFVRQLHFPLFGTAVNDNTIQLNNDFNKSGALESPTIAAGLVDANAGKRQYARATVLPNIVLGRLFLGYVADSQFAAVSKGAGTNLVDLRYRQASGPVLGFSATDKKGRFYLGVSGALLERKEVFTTVDYEQIADPDSRKSALRDGLASYSGDPANAGFIWVLSPTARPALAIAATDIGNTSYTNRSSSFATPLPSLRVHQNVTTSFSVSPQLGHWGYLNLALEADRFHETDMALAKKIKTGLELSFGSHYGTRSIFALRGGYAAAGASYGFLLNIGLVGIEAADHAVDIGPANQRLIERRKSAILGINIAEY